MNSISNFRKSSKISEKIYSNIYNINEFNKHNYKEIYLLKEEIIAYQDNISDYKTKIKHKTKYINRGLNNIILSMAIIIILIVTLFLLIGNVI